METKTKKVLGVVGLVILLLVVFNYSSREVPLGGFQNGIVLTVATTSQLSVGTTAISVFATSTCATRVISTTDRAIMLTFSDRLNQTPTGVFGHLQSASTTVSYDAGIYGCGLYKVFGFDAKSNITVTELR